MYGAVRDCVDERNVGLSLLEFTCNCKQLHIKCLEMCSYCIYRKIYTHTPICTLQSESTDILSSKWNRMLTANAERRNRPVRPFSISRGCCRAPHLVLPTVRDSWPIGMYLFSTNWDIFILCSVMPRELINFWTNWGDTFLAICCYAEDLRLYITQIDCYKFPSPPPPTSKHFQLSPKERGSTQTLGITVIITCRRDTLLCQWKPA